MRGFPGARGSPLSDNCNLHGITGIPGPSLQMRGLARREAVAPGGLGEHPVYGYQVVNVESQMNNPSSFLRWTREMLSVRHRESVLGDGDFRLLSVDNDAILAFARFVAREERVVLCVFNFASKVQPVTVDLRDWDGRVPVELLGMTPFPAIDASGAYGLTLAPYGFLWFELCVA